MTHAQFAGSIPETYERHLGPLFFEPYAGDLAGRLGAISSRDPRVLELACGTGRLTRHLLARLAPGGRLVATDLNPAMLDVAQARLGPSPQLEWQAADAATLPYPDGSFDAVVCQFGFMFFPDKPAAAREIARVLRLGGELLFNVWDSLERNPLARIAHETIAGFFGGNPPDFYLVPFGYHDAGVIRAALQGAGLSDIRIEKVALEARAPDPEHVAVGLVRGNPVLNAIRERGAVEPEIIVQALSAALGRLYGNGVLRAPMEALVVAARRPDGEAANIP